MCLDFITREKLIIISLRITAGIQVAAKYTKSQRMRYNNAITGLEAADSIE